jgi:predicted RNA-binding Zn ribbon-like protein
MSVPMLVALVNGWGTVPRDRGGARARPGLEAFGADHGVADAGALTDARLERVADRLYPVFAAEDDAERARLVTGLLTASGVRPALETHREGIERAWRIPGSRDPVLASAAVALLEQLIGTGGGRLGVCASGGCGDVYVDASPGAQRRYCSLTCQSRERVAAFRRRRAGRPAR